MNVFDSMRAELRELLLLVRESERYCTSIAHRPELSSDALHAAELRRKHRISELSARFVIES